MASPAFFLLVFCASATQCLAQTDTLHNSTLHEVEVSTQHEPPHSTLHEVEVSTQRFTSKLRSDKGGTVHWDLSMMRKLPKILGNADPLHHAQMLPSIQTNSEYDAGLHVQGCTTGQSLVGVGDAPVYNAAHLLGFFSTFNPNHYPTLTLRTYSTTDGPNVVGGMLRMEQPTQHPDSLTASLDVGLISSQATLQIPLDRRQHLVVSARQAYLNLLYGRYIQFDDASFRYDFGDYNLTYALQLPRHQLSVNAFYSHDKAKLGAGNLDMDMRMRWTNMAFSAELDSRPAARGTTLHQALFHSAYHSQANLEQAWLQGTLPSSMQTTGYRLTLDKDFPDNPARTSGRGWHLQAGLLAQYHRIVPQHVVANSFVNLANDSLTIQKALEVALHAEASLHLSDQLTASAGTKLTLYRLFGAGEKTYLHPAPHISISYDSPRLGRFDLRYAHSQQYLHQAGFSSMGLPTEFRFSSSTAFKPQQADALSLHYSVPLWQGRYRLTAELYGKWLTNQTEYHGDILSFLTTGYSMQNTLITGKGYNYGLNLQFVKQTGRLTGWISYAYARSMRQFDRLAPTRFFPSNYERPHELNIVATYNLHHRWDVGATFVLASGTPFTAIKQVYFLSNNIVAEYGEHNANRLKPYCRMDLSVDYHFNPIKHRWRHHLNLSLYNVLCISNDIFYRLKIYHNTYRYRASRFVLNILPSISYHFEY